MMELNSRCRTCRVVLLGRTRSSAAPGEKSDGDGDREDVPSPAPECDGCEEAFSFVITPQAFHVICEMLFELVESGRCAASTEYSRLVAVLVGIHDEEKGMERFAESQEIVG